MNFFIREEKALKIGSKPVNIDFLAKNGELNFLTGANGVGKSTFFTFLKTRGDLFKGSQASFMDQPPFNPLSDMRAQDALAVVEEEVPNSRSWRDLEAGKLLAIEELLNKNISHLSGGENQKIKLMLALMRPFELLFADEPLQSLDEGNQKKILFLFNELAKEGKTLVLIEHDIGKYHGGGGIVNHMVEREKEINIIHD